MFSILQSFYHFDPITTSTIISTKQKMGQTEIKYFLQLNREVKLTKSRETDVPVVTFTGRV